MHAFGAVRLMSTSPNAAALTASTRPPLTRAALARRAWIACWVVAIAVYPYLDSLAVLDAYFVVGGFAAAVAVVAGVRINRPRTARAWLTFAAGLAVMAVGQAIWMWFEVVEGTETPFPSMADIAYLAFYAFAAAFLLMLTRSVERHRRWIDVLDAAIITTGITVFIWVTVVAPAASDGSSPLLTQLVTVAYPLADVLVGAVTAYYLTVRGIRNTSVWLLIAAFAGLMVSDTAFGIQALAGTYHGGNWVDVGWLVCYAAAGLASLHPSMAAPDEADPGDLEVRTGADRFVAMGMAAVLMTVPILLGYGKEATTGTSTHIGALVFFVLVIARLAVTVRAHERTASSLRAQQQELRSTVGGLSQMERERERLLHMAVDSAEQERARLAADLHDGPIQMLTVIGYGMERLAQLHGNDVEAATMVERLDDQLRSQIKGLRELMTELRPPVLDQRGLANAVRDYAREFERRNGVTCHVASAVDNEPDKAVEVVLYRIVQEALTNVAKHAGATHVHVSLISGADRLFLSVTDDGAGFDEEAMRRRLDGHFGVDIMRERVQMIGGTFTLTSRPGSGTAITASVPCGGST